jgi:dTDP-4-dehydrorhamnose reductase
MIVVLGGSGFLGSYLMKELDAVGTSSSGSFDTIKLDARDEEGLRALLKELRPEAVVNVDGMTGVDACEKDPRAAEEINGRAVGMTASACSELGVPYFHISTDYVFDGEKGRYKENDPPNPINEYGRSKLMGERETLSRGGVVIRISTPFGPNPSKRKQSFAEFVASSLRQGKEVRAASDLFSTPTYTPYVARLITALLEDEKKDGVMKGRKEGGKIKGEIYHVGSVERVSRYDFAVTVARILGLDESLVRPVSASQLSFIAKRPKDTSFDVSKALKLVSIRPLEEDLRELALLLRDTDGRTGESGCLLGFL